MPTFSSTLYYFHDPMCSWCWGYRPVWQQLKSALPADIQVENVLGGLAPDTNEPMPEELQRQIQAHWRRIRMELGTEFNFDFWSNNVPRRSTYPACRAVLAADRQGQQEAMIEAIQRAYYLRALNPSNTEVLTQLAAELSLDVERFCSDVESDELDEALMHQVRFSRSANIAGFPSLLLRCDGEELPIAIDYQDYRPTLAQIEVAIRPD